MQYSFKKSEILKGKKYFKYIYNEGKKLSGKKIQCFYIKKPRGEIKLKSQIQVGFKVSTKIKRAVERNRVKRLMRESYRLNKSIIVEHVKVTENSLHLIFSYLPKIQDFIQTPKFYQIEQDIKTLLLTIIKQDL